MADTRATWQGPQTAKDRANKIDALKNDDAYQSMISYLSGETNECPRFTPEDESDLPRAERGSYAEKALLDANYSLKTYLSFQQTGVDREGNPVYKDDDLHTALGKWHEEMAKRIKNNTLNNSQKEELIEQIYTHLFIAQNLDCPFNTETRSVSKETSKTTHLVTQEINSNIGRAKDLNEKISHWSGYRALAGFGLMLFGAFLMVVAGCAVASGLDSVTAPLFVTAMASINGEAVMAAAAYVAWRTFGFKQEQNQKMVREAKLATFITREIYAETYKKVQSWEKRATCMLRLRNSVCSVAGAAAPGLLATTIPNGTASQTHASLALSKNVSAKIALTGKESTACQVWGVWGAMSLMFLLAGVGAHAIYVGGSMIVEEYKKKYTKDPALRAKAIDFFRAVDPTQTQSNAAPTTTSQLRPMVAAS